MAGVTSPSTATPSGSAAALATRATRIHGATGTSPSTTHEIYPVTGLGSQASAGHPFRRTAPRSPLFESPAVARGLALAASLRDIAGPLAARATDLMPFLTQHAGAVSVLAVSAATLYLHGGLAALGASAVAATTVPILPEGDTAPSESDGPPPLPQSEPAAVPMGAAVDEAALALHAAPTLDLSATARAVAMSVPLSQRGQRGVSGVDHAAFTGEVSGAAQAARAAVDGKPKTAAPALQLTPTPLMLFKDGLGTVQYETVQTDQGPRLLATVEIGKTSGIYRFNIANYGAGSQSNGNDWINLNDKTVSMNHAWVDVDLNRRMVVVSAKGASFAPHDVGGRLERMKPETQRIIQMGNATQVRLRFGNSYVDVVIPPATDRVIADFRGRFAAAEARGNVDSIFGLINTPNITVQDTTVHIAIGGTNRSLKLEMPVDTPSDVAIDLIAEALHRVNLSPTSSDNVLPLAITIRWTDSKAFAARVEAMSLDTEATHAALTRGLVATDIQMPKSASVTIELPDRYVPSPHLSMTMGPEDPEVTRLSPRMEVRQLSAALGLARHALVSRLPQQPHTLAPAWDVLESPDADTPAQAQVRSLIRRAAHSAQLLSALHRSTPGQAPDSAEKDKALAPPRARFEDVDVGF